MSETIAGIGEMAALNRFCPELDNFAGASTAGATLPFLPTLVVAALFGVGALCWDKTEPTSIPTASTVMTSSRAMPLPQMARIGLNGPLVEDSPRLPASLAFAERFPMVLGAPAVAVARAEPRPFLRIARNAPPPSGCVGQRCREGLAQIASSPMHRPHVAALAATLPAAARPFASAQAEEETTAAAVSDQTPPDRALPFAPTLMPAIRALQRTAGLVGSQAVAIGTDAVALCDSITGLAGPLR